MIKDESLCHMATNSRKNHTYIKYTAFVSHFDKFIKLIGVENILFMERIESKIRPWKCTSIYVLRMKEREQIGYKL